MTGTMADTLQIATRKKGYQNVHLFAHVRSARGAISAAEIGRERVSRDTRVCSSLCLCVHASAKMPTNSEPERPFARLRVVKTRLEYLSTAQLRERLAWVGLTKEADTVIRKILQERENSE